MYILELSSSLSLSTLSSLRRRMRRREEKHQICLEEGLKTLETSHRDV